MTNDTEFQRKPAQDAVLVDEISAMFDGEEPGWGSEEEMIRDLADFRRSRTGANVDSTGE